VVDGCNQEYLIELSVAVADSDNKDIAKRRNRDADT